MLWDYIGKNKDAYRCTLNPLYGYGANRAIIESSTTPGAKRPKVAKPSATITFGDATGVGYDPASGVGLGWHWGGMIAPLTRIPSYGPGTACNGRGLMAIRHLGRANLAFVDGHVDDMASPNTLSPEDLWDNPLPP